LARAARAAAAGLDLLLAVVGGINSPGPSGEPLLQAAVTASNADAVRWLLAHGAAVNAAYSGQTAAGAKASTRPAEYGMTPLWQAAAVGDTEMVRVLLEAGADANWMPTKHRTPTWTTT
jgi:ankyrin repeat protein